MSTLLLGSSGSLGTELRKLNSDIIAPLSDECDIIRFMDVTLYITER